MKSIIEKKQTNNNSIDWTKPCLITDVDETGVWINMPLIDSGDSEYFHATLISNPTGMHSTGLKKYFKLFTGEITLSND